MHIDYTVVSYLREAQNRHVYLEMTTLGKCPFALRLTKGCTSTRYKGEVQAHVTKGKYNVPIVTKGKF